MIQIDPMTKDICLIVTDFEDEYDKEENIQLWIKQIENLKKAYRNINNLKGEKYTYT